MRKIGKKHLIIHNKKFNYGLKKIVVVISGGFDPLHPGHIRLIKEAKRLGDKLIVLLNNDNWLSQKKGVVFMPQKQRREVLLALKGVDRVIYTKHPKKPKDMSVVADLKNLSLNIFANGGDRNHKNIPEYNYCKSKKITMVFNVGKGGKIESSSWLLKKYVSNSKE